MNKQEFKNIVGNTFFSVTFKKKNGDLRKLNGRLHVKTGVKGTGVPVSQEVDETLIKVYEMNKKQWRSFHINAMINLKARGKVYETKSVH